MAFDIGASYPSPLQRRILATMAQEEHVLEIPRNVRANAWKLAAGVLLLGLGAVSTVAAVSEDPRMWLVVALYVGSGVPLVASNARLLVTRPLVLRATSAGLWFGAGAIIPWQEIAAIYEAGVQIERYGYRVRTRAINIAFRRVRVMFRVPSWLWLTTWSPGHVKISLYAIDELPMVVVARLQAMWMSACGQGDAASGAGELPPARVVERT
jgi:hypothetical protein